MPFEKLEYEFPDPEKKEKEKEQHLKVEIEASDDEVDIDIVDDTPVKDRNRKPADTPPADVTDEELEEYSEKVRKRIQHFSRGYHDERRAKESAVREKEEALRAAQAIADENRRLKGTVNKNQHDFSGRSASGRRCYNITLTARFIRWFLFSILELLREHLAHTSINSLVVVITFGINSLLHQFLMKS